MAVSDTARRTLAAVLGLNQGARALPTTRRRGYPLWRRCIAAILGVSLPAKPTQPDSLAEPSSSRGYSATEADLGGSGWTYMLAPPPPAPRPARFGVVSVLVTLAAALIAAATTFATLGTESGTVWPETPPTDSGPPGRSHCFYSSDSSHPLVSQGMKGDEVKQVQCLLHFNYPVSVAITGIFDSDTEGAVRFVQTCNDIVADGIVGPETWEVLEHPPSTDKPEDPCGPPPSPSRPSPS